MSCLTNRTSRCPMRRTFRQPALEGSNCRHLIMVRVEFGLSLGSLQLQYTTVRSISMVVGSDLDGMDHTLDRHPHLEAAFHTLGQPRRFPRTTKFSCGSTLKRRQSLLKWHMDGCSGHGRQRVWMSGATLLVSLEVGSHADQRSGCIPISVHDQ